MARYGYYDYQTIKDYHRLHRVRKLPEANVELSTLRIYYSRIILMKASLLNGRPVVASKSKYLYDYACTVISKSEGTTLSRLNGLVQPDPKKAVLLNGELYPINPQELGAHTGTDKKAYAGFSISKPATTAFGNGGVVLNHGNAAPPPYQ